MDIEQKGVPLTTIDVGKFYVIRFHSEGPAADGSREIYACNAREAISAQKVHAPRPTSLFRLTHKDKPRIDITLALQKRTTEVLSQPENHVLEAVYKRDGHLQSLFCRRLTMIRPEHEDAVFFTVFGARMINRVQFSLHRYSLVSFSKTPEGEPLRVEKVYPMDDTWSDGGWNAKFTGVHGQILMAERPDTVRITAQQRWNIWEDAIVIDVPRILPIDPAIRQALFKNGSNHLSEAHFLMKASAAWVVFDRAHDSGGFAGAT